MVKTNKQDPPLYRLYIWIKRTFYIGRYCKNYFLFIVNNNNNNNKSEWEELISSEDDALQQFLLLTSSIQKLPLEMIERIFSYLGPKDLCCCSQVYMWLFIHF